MRESIEHSRSWKKYHFTEAEFKNLLGITWPGGILTVRAGWAWSGIEITMSVRPEELPNKPESRSDPGGVPVQRLRRWRKKPR